MQFDLVLVEAPSITAALEAELVPRAGLDVLHHAVPALSISDVRLLKNLAHTSAFTESERTVVIGATQITLEAQNALLKLFEEVPSGTRLMLVIPHESILLPTVRSRFVSVIKAHATTTSSIGDEFLQLSYPARLALIADKVKNKDVLWISSLVTEIVVSLSSQPKYASTLGTLALVESYIKNRGASRKMLLEELALSLPVVPS